MEQFSSLNIFLIISLIILFFSLPFLFISTLQNTIKATNPKNRTIEPYEVWLYFIPVIGLFFHFNHILKITNTLKYDFEDKKINHDNERFFGANFGLTYSLINIGYFFYLIYKISTLSTYSLIETKYLIYDNNESNFLSVGTGVLFIVSGICFIVFWSKMSNCKRILISMNNGINDHYKNNLNQNKGYQSNNIKQQTCFKCGANSPLEHKFCMECGSSDFINNIDAIKKEIEHKKEILNLKRLFYSKIITEKEFVELKEKLLTNSDFKENLEDLINNKKVEISIEEKVKISINEKECPNCKFIINKETEKCEFCDYDFINTLVDKEEKILVEPKLEQYQTGNDNQNSKKGLYILIGFIVLIISGTWFYMKNQDKLKTKTELPISVTPEIVNKNLPANEIPYVDTEPSTPSPGEVEAAESYNESNDSNESFSSENVQEFMNQYYQDLCNNNIDVNKYFSENVNQFITLKNTTSGEVDYQLNTVAKNEFRNTKIEFIGNIEESKVDSDIRYYEFSIYFETFRVSKKKNTSCNIDVEIGINSDFKIVSYKEIRYYDYKSY